MPAEIRHTTSKLFNKALKADRIQNFKKFKRNGSSFNLLPTNYSKQWSELIIYKNSFLETYSLWNVPPNMQIIHDSEMLVQVIKFQVDQIYRFRFEHENQ